MLGQHFEQILFISHDGAFDSALFPYHIHVDDGVIVESNLPVDSGYAQDDMLVAPPHTQAPLELEANGHSNGMTQLPISASQAL
jgi:hypothetical protein